MTNEILFKGKSISENRWFEGFYFKTFSFCVKKYFIFYKNEETETRCFTQVSYNTITQYTGINTSATNQILPNY